jgi:diguanylate cyclase (GGDEF)-like protein
LPEKINPMDASHFTYPPPASDTLERLRSSLQRLNEVAAMVDIPFEEHLRQALRAGCEHFGLPYGIVSHVAGNDYTLLSQVSPPDTLRDGQAFALGQTYCVLTLQGTEVMAIHHMGTSEYQGHPCYDAFGLETYIGVPLVVAGRVYGTLNFSSPQPYDRVFDDMDRNFIVLMSRWIGSVIERKLSDDRIRASERRYRSLFMNMQEGLVFFKVVEEAGQVVDLIYRETNPAFEMLLQLGDVQGKLLSEVFAGQAAHLQDFLERCGRVIREGSAEVYELYFEPLQKWYGISLYCPEPGAVISVFQDISSRKHHEARILELANVDSLTGLPNRRMLESRLDQCFSQAVRSGRAFALLFLDLDNFKVVNDTLGHEVGDQLLVSVAQRLKNSLRAEDTLARVGGDEFVIILSEVAFENDAKLAAQKILDTLQPPLWIAGHEVYAHASIGIGVYPQSGARDAATLMGMADQAMYEAKRAGRNGFHLFRG